MLRSLSLSVVAACLCAWPASSWASVHTPWEIASVQIHEVKDLSAPVVQFSNDCSGLSDPRDLDNPIGLDDIVAIGQKIWNIVVANKPVVTTDIPTIQALPRGVQCWADLDSWKAPLVKSYDVVYKNYLGMQVVKFRFRLQFTYGGGRNGVGQYVANATVIPADLSVLWGYTFNAQVDVPDVVNVGTHDKPVAGVGMDLKWDVKTVMKENDSSVHFFVRGDGQVQVDQ